MVLERLLGRKNRDDERKDEFIQRIGILHCYLPNDNENGRSRAPWVEISHEDLTLLPEMEYQYLLMSQQDEDAVNPRIFAHMEDENVWLAVSLGYRRVKFKQEENGYSAIYEIYGRDRRWYGYPEKGEGEGDSEVVKRSLEIDKFEGLLLVAEKAAAIDDFYS